MDPQHVNVCELTSPPSTTLLLLLLLLFLFLKALSKKKNAPRVEVEVPEWSEESRLCKMLGRRLVLSPFGITLSRSVPLRSLTRSELTRSSNSSFPLIVHKSPSTSVYLTVKSFSSWNAFWSWWGGFRVGKKGNGIGGC